MLSGGSHPIIIDQQTRCQEISAHLGKLPGVLSTPHPNTRHGFLLPPLIPVEYGIFHDLSKQIERRNAVENRSSIRIAVFCPASPRMAKCPAFEIHGDPMVWPGMPWGTCSLIFAFGVGYLSTLSVYLKMRCTS